MYINDTLMLFSQAKKTNKWHLYGKFCPIFVADKCTVQSVNTCQQEKIPPKTEK